MAHSLSPRMHNAAFEALGLDWTYVAWDVEREELEDVLSRLAGLGYAGANVTTPYKQDVARLAGASEESVNTLLFDPLRATSTDAAILEGLEHERAVIVGDGGAAARFRAALPAATVFSRRASGRRRRPAPTSSSTPPRRRTRSSCRSGRDQTLVDLPYPGSATAAAARAAGARVLDGLEVLVAQGAASFELWTGEPAPVEVMRRAVGLSSAPPRDSG